MLADTAWAVNLLISTSTLQPETITWSNLLEKLQQIMPVPWLWISLPLLVSALLFVLVIGDQLSGILGWLGIESPFQSSIPSESTQQKTRRKLLQRLKREVNHSLETSLHEQVRLDLCMEDQSQQVGKPKIEIIPQDSLDTSLPPIKSLLNRVFQPFRKQEAPPIPLEPTQNIVNIFDRGDIQGKLVILGQPGAGKTTELLRLTQVLLERASEDENLPIPLILEVSSWEEGKTIAQHIASVLKQKPYLINASIIHKWLQDDDIIPLLDGLDEVGLTNQNKYILEINSFLEERARYGLVVCCRQEEYEAGQIILSALNGAVYLNPLRDWQIQYFFERLNRLRIWEQLKNNLTLLELARSPLFLSMLVVAYQGNSITNQEELFDAFISKKLSQRNKLSVYRPNEKPDSRQTCIYLAWLAKQLQNKDFLIEDLQPNLLAQCQEKLSQYELIVLLADFLVFLLVAGLILFLRGWLNVKIEGGLDKGLVLGLSFGLSFVVNFAVFIGLKRKWINGLNAPIRLSEKLYFSFSNGLRKGLIAGLKAGSFFGGFLGVIFGLFFGLNNGLRFGMITGLAYGLIIGLLNYLIIGLRIAPTDERDFSNQGTWQSLRNSVTAGLGVGLIFGLIFGLAAGLTAGLIAGVIFGLIFGMIFGLESVIRHVALRVVLTRNGHIPRDYALFLDYAVELRFMQRIGGRYRFVHNLLRKHFATMDLE